MELFAREVHSLASDAQTRARYEGKTVRVQGLLVVSRNEHVFSLVPILDHRLDIEIPRPLTVVVDDSQVQDQPLDEREPDWPHLNRKLVNVLGTIQFHEPVDAPGRWDAILVVHPTKDVPVSELIKSAYADP
jgi:hypothetical protein